MHVPSNQSSPHKLHSWNRSLNSWAMAYSGPTGRFMACFDCVNSCDFRGIDWSQSLRSVRLRIRGSCVLWGFSVLNSRLLYRLKDFQAGGSTWTIWRCTLKSWRWNCWWNLICFFHQLNNWTQRAADTEIPKGAIIANIQHRSMKKLPSACHHGRVRSLFYHSPSLPWWSIPFRMSSANCEDP